MDVRADARTLQGEQFIQIFLPGAIISVTGVMFSRSNGRCERKFKKGVMK
jgi:hypothetical protein